METRWWTKSEGRKSESRDSESRDSENRVRCNLCPRHCDIPDGKRGFCFVRKNTGGKMELSTYGRSTGFCIDPVEKKPLNHFLPGTPILSFGTAGCNLGCKFCQNWDISKSKETEILSHYASPEAIVEAALLNKCRSIAFTYNDPVIWAEYAIDTARVAQQAGLKTVAVTAGYITPEARPDFFRHFDAANIDLKAFTEDFYQSITLSHLEPVLDTLRWLKHESNVWFEITNLLIPGKNDSVDEVEQMANWIVANLGVDVPLHFSAFHPDYKMQDIPRTPAETLQRARRQALAAGIKYAYVGNVDDSVGQSTYCPGCGISVIERNWYELGEFHIRSGFCDKCGTPIAGVFEDRPGNWGRKRQPIQFKTSLTISKDLPKPVTPIEPKTDFTEDERRELLRFCREVVNGCVIAKARGESPDLVLENISLPVSLHEVPAFGVFTTLERGSLLRACLGHWGSESEKTLGSVLKAAAFKAALLDPRFPAIEENELQYLTVELSLMHNSRLMSEQGIDRLKAVVVGKHGLVISHPRGRGVLLPQVAAEAGWSSEQFLEQLCRKAGLEKDAWSHTDAELTSFEAVVLQDAPTKVEADLSPITDSALLPLFQLTNSILQNEPLQLSLSDSLTRLNAGDMGVCLATSTGDTSVVFGRDTSLARLVEQCTRSLLERSRQQNETPAVAGMVTEILILSNPIRLTPSDSPDRMRVLVGSAIVGRKEANLGVFLPPPEGKTHPITLALNALTPGATSWNGAEVSLTAFKARGIILPRTPLGGIRKPSKAGLFYPENPADIREQVERLLTPKGKLVDARAIMLPHAGWHFCGEVLGKTLAQVEIPKRVIVLSPKHTRNGPPLSVPPHDFWELPGGGVKIDTALRELLLNITPGLPCEAEAHAGEHGVEVLLPFLSAKNRDVQIVPLVMGALPVEAIGHLAKALGRILKAAGERILLVISSDMNHFASRDENRRLDELALSALKSGDPQTLYNTCAENKISMCGLIPAVTVLQALNYSARSTVEITAYSDSSVVNGDFAKVVGYAGAIFS